MNTGNESSTNTPGSSPKQPADDLAERLRKILSGETPLAPLRPGVMISPERRKQLGLDMPRTYIHFKAPSRPPKK